MAPPALPLLGPERSNSPRRDVGSSAIKCCCGRVDCVLLKRNCSVLDTVEKDVHTAAQLGQALLARHEAYMADAERDRLDLTARIERLEIDKQLLEAENAHKIEENRNLLDQLELLNSTVSDSDTKIKRLESSLLSSQQTIRRLESAAARAADAERHLAILEEEQDKLQQELRATREDARSHAQRCKEAQRGILDMQDQLERIETESRQERDRHAEVVGRMQRQREVEKQLDTAAGRLKGAAATKTFGGDPKNGNKIVGHFVRDLLQDNANLQLGIAELREMLMNSNDEVQSLREQLMYHQPVPEQDNHNDSPASTLKAELEPPQDPVKLSQELHIHHHYHVTPKQEIRKPKKKRQGLMPGIFTPPALSRPSTPGNSGQWGLISAAPKAPAVVTHAGDDATPTLSKPSAANNWSPFPNTPSEISSSVPSSPQSNQRSFLFDNGYPESDPLTSPSTSYDPFSPTMRASHQKRPSVASSHSFQSLSRLDTGSDTHPPVQPLQHKHVEHAIQEEDDEDEERLGDMAYEADEATPTEHSTMDDSESSRDDYMPQPRLRRTTSHESIMSLSGGLDIHTLKIRPSQMTLRPLGGADAVVTGITAQPIMSRSSAKRSDAALRDNFAGFRSPRAVSSPISQLLSPGPSNASPGGSGGLGKWVGWRPWGGGSSPNSARSTSKAAQPVAEEAEAAEVLEPAEASEPANVVETPAASQAAAVVQAEPSKDTDTIRSKDKVQGQPGDKENEWDFGRAPGINQPGAIPGFQQYWAAQKRKGAPAKVTAERVDRDALVDGLQE